VKKALLLTYYWPPGSGPGVQRWLKFCKYLPGFDWEVEVITVENGSYPSTDESLLNDVPDGMKIIRTKTIEPFAIYNALRGKSGNQVEVGMSNLKGKPSLFKRFSNYIRANYFVPDARVGWNTYAFPAALKRVKAFQPDVIITTGPPHSTHLMGQRLKAMYNIPWIADFRDPWTSIYYNAFLNRTASTKKKDQALENKVLSSADAIVVASTGMQAEFQDRANAITFIPNGYDPIDFDQEGSPPSDRFRIAYVGNLKSNQNVEAFWNALMNIQKRSDIKIELEITGNIAEDVQERIRAKGLSETVRIEPFVPHRAAVHRMLSAHALFLPIPQSAQNHSILTGKLFEYLATRRPIFALGPIEGNASMILKDCDKAAMIDYTDEDQMVKRLEELLTIFQEKSGSAWETGNQAFAQYSRKETAATLAKMMNKFVA
jgi:glycosyltransferase involved in cell wall biosynthesis